MVARKDLTMNKHNDVDVPNLYVIKLMQSMVSRGYVKEQFSWMWFYWYLTNEGIEFLRDDLGLLPEIVPITLKKPRSQPRPFQTPRERDRGGSRGDRASSPRGGRREGEEGAAEKKESPATSGFAPSFRKEGGEGRGGDRERRPGGGGMGRGGGFGRPSPAGGDRGGYRRDSPSGDRPGGRGGFGRGGAGGRAGGEAGQDS